jgi:hypothetical protein
MTVPTQVYTWEQGTDLVLKFIHRTGPDAQSMTPTDLTGYDVRMDIRATNVMGERVYTFNSADIADVDPLTAGDQADSVVEAVQGADGSINITVPRALTLPGGAIYEKMTADPPVTVFVADIILRDAGGKQSKILSLTISINPSATLWT